MSMSFSWYVLVSAGHSQFSVRNASSLGFELQYSFRNGISCVTNMWRMHHHSVLNCAIASPAVMLGSCLHGPFRNSSNLQLALVFRARNNDDDDTIGMQGVR